MLRVVARELAQNVSRFSNVRCGFFDESAWRLWRLTGYTEVSARRILTSGLPIIRPLRELSAIRKPCSPRRISNVWNSLASSREIATGLRSKQTSTQLCSGALEPQAKGTNVFGLWADQSPISKLLKAMSRPSEHAA
jgi:hypothetical protein